MSEAGGASKINSVREAFHASKDSTVLSKRWEDFQSVGLDDDKFYRYTWLYSDRPTYGVISDKNASSASLGAPNVRIRML